MRLAIIAAFLASPLAAQEGILDRPCGDILEAIKAPGDMEAEIMMFRGIEGVAEANKFAGFYSGVAFGFVTAKAGNAGGDEWVHLCKEDDSRSFGDVLNAID